MKAHAVVRLNFSSDKHLQVVIQALKPEVETSTTNRSKVQMTTDCKTLVLDFMAEDTSALRASMNSYLRLIGLAMDIKKFTNR
jgi:KEOPS complex subunit Pcc1